MRIRESASVESVDCLVVGAGVVGLAVARALARAGREVIVVESQECIGSGISSRNSEVIHAGIYYATGLDKTRWCVKGKSMLYEFCQEHHVPHRLIGKLLVAGSEAEVEKLFAIKAQAEANGVMDLVWLSGSEARALEPALTVHRALLSPSTGIIDSHALMHALRGDAERYGAMVALQTPVLSGRVADGGIILEAGGASPNTDHCKCRNQRRRARRTCPRPLSHWNAPRQHSTSASCKGELFRIDHAVSLHAPDLSDPDSWRPWRSSYP